MRLLRQQESTPFFTAEEGRKRRFFQNFPCRLHRLVLQFSCLRIWGGGGCCPNLRTYAILSWFMCLRYNLFRCLEPFHMIFFAFDSIFVRTG